jgi:Fe2+ or Zn2+ uptake regulation protein
VTGVKGKQFIKRLKARGVRITKKRGKGGHVLAEHAGHQAPILSPVFIKKICKQLRIDPNEIL